VFIPGIFRRILPRKIFPRRSGTKLRDVHYAPNCRPHNFHTNFSLQHSEYKILDNSGFIIRECIWSV